MADREALYLDDVHVGSEFVSDEVTITAEDIIAFATQFDPQPFHLDPEAAKRSFFGGLAASGWHTAAITMRLLVTGGPMIAGEQSEPGANSPGLRQLDPATDSTSTSPLRRSRRQSPIRVAAAPS